MRRCLLFMSLILCLAVLPGCWDSVEIDNLGIAIAASVDLMPNHKIRFSEQVYVPSPSALGDSVVGESGGTHYFVFSGIGENIRAAHLDLQKQLSRRLFIADRNLYLISEDVARQGIKPYIDELVRNPQSRMRTHIAITRGEAYKYLEVRYPFEQTPGAALRKLLFGRASNYTLDLNGMLRMLEKPGQNVYAPLVELNPTAPHAEEAFKHAGLAILKGGKMIGTLNPEQSKGVLWLRQLMKFNTVTTSLPGHHGKMTSDLLRTRVNYDVSLSNGHPKLQITLVCEDDILENNTDIDLNDPNNLAFTQRVFSQDIENSIRDTLDVLQHKYNTDILDFHQIIYRAYPREFKQSFEKNWDKEFAHMKIDVQVIDEIRRIGMTGRSLTYPSNYFQR